MRRLFFLPLCTMLLVACGVPENQAGHVSATLAAQPAPTLAATQEASMSNEQSSTPTAAQQHQAQPTDQIPATATQTSPTGAILVPAEKFIALASADLAKRLSITTDQVTLINALPMTWPNAALGCPQPGKVYATGHIPGYRIILEAQRQQHQYNTDLTGQVLLCSIELPDAPTSSDPSTSGPTIAPQIGVPIK